MTINFATILCKRYAVRKFAEAFQCYKVGFHNIALKGKGSIFRESRDRILRESKNANNFVKAHLVLVLITGILIIPIGEERDTHLSVVLFEKYYPLYVVEGIYFLSFPIIAYVSVRLAYNILYFVLHAKFQVFMLLDYIKGIVDDYEDIDDSNLLESREYQTVVKGRLNEMVLKINMLIK